MIKRAVYCIVGLILMGTLFVCCSGSITPAIEEETGMLSVSINLPASAQTVLPILPIEEYIINFSNGPQSHADVTVTGATTNVELAIGTWDVSVDALNSTGAIIASGGETGVVINADLTTEVTITLYLLTSGTGTVDVTVSWPEEVAIDTVECLLDGVSVDAADLVVLSTTAACLAETLAGNYVLEFILKTGTLVQAYVVEAVQVYGNVTSEETLYLTISDFTTAPQAPSALSATSDLTQISLTWNDNSFVETSYILERSEEDNQNYVVLDGALPPNTTSYNDTTVSTGALYYYQVQARNDFGSSPYSDEISATKDIGNVVLLSPSNGTNIEDTTPLLSWNANGGASRYHLVVADNDLFNLPIIDTDTVTATSYQFSGVASELLANNSTYYWKVAPIDSTGAQSDYSNAWQFTVSINPPAIVFPTTWVIDDSKPVLEWSASALVDAIYDIQLASDNGFETIIEQAQGLTVLQYETGTLSHMAEYYWRVRVVDALGVVGNWSTDNFLIDLGTVYEMMPETGTTADSTPTLSWEAAWVAVQYHLLIDDAADFSSPNIDLSNISSVSYELSGTPPELLTNGVTYHWKVAPIDANGVEGDFSEVHYLTVDIDLGVTFDPQMNEPFEITVEGLQTFYATTSIMVVANIVGSGSFDQIWWDVDGNVLVGENDPSLTFGADLAAGSHELTVAVRSGNTLSSKSLFFEVRALEIGEPYAGGIVFYLDGFGGGLVAAMSEQIAAAIWGGDGTVVGGTLVAVGSGAANTEAILNTLGAAAFAASFCAELSLEGYDDWFLPSKDELNLMYENKEIIGGFETANYWSSSEVHGYNAWSQSFGTGDQVSEYKGNARRVRAIRAF